MNVNDRIHGFLVKEVREEPELRATMVRMEYEKNGADLLWLDRPDDNKTFSIAFKTIPSDDTGVFHILEHSVLNGSEKYPVKEPFVELLKSSLQTFLNAMTFPDKTMYPVSSRNDRDFLNLMDVYLDAVLHPLSVKDPHAFLQEGWHFELDGPEDTPRFNGVVFNEMKGAYASPDSVQEEKLTALLFPDTCYGHDSGGNPEYITDLTYENYLRNHARFYHPSNARIFLDGSIDPDAVLGKLDEFLRDFDRIEVDAEIPYQAPVTPEEQTVPYEIGEDDPEENKVLLAEGYVYGTYEDTLKNMAFSVISAVLTGSNEAPLKKAILERDLAEDISLRPFDESMQQPFLAVTVDNTSLEKKDAVFAAVREVFTEAAEKGLDRTRVNAVLNNLEFTTREKDFGGMPKGLIYAITSLDSWLYGGDPMQNLLYDELFRTLREKVENGYLEDLIRTDILESRHHARLVMVPSRTLGQEKAEAEAARAKDAAKDWDDAKKQEVIDTFKKLRARQNTPDTPEQLATLPMLSLSDIPSSVPMLNEKVSSLSGVTVLDHPNDTDGITYLDLYFSLSDIPQDELSEIAFYSALLGQLPTEHFDVLALRSEIEANLGVFAAAPVVFPLKSQIGLSKDFLSVRLSFLRDKADAAVRILKEVLGSSDFSDRQYIGNILRQMKFGMEQSVIGAGNSFGFRHALSCFTPAGAVQECFSGLRYLRTLQALDQNFSENAGPILEKLQTLGTKLFTRSRLTISVTGAYADSLLPDVLRILPEGTKPEVSERTAFPKENLAVVIPAEVGFAAEGVHMAAVGLPSDGRAEVASQYLTFNHLWNTIRVKGGAYGAGLRADDEGSTAFYSYRDPNPSGSLAAFSDCGKELRAFCANDIEEIDKYIISTISNTDPLLTPRTAGRLSASLYFRGMTHADREKERAEILKTDKASLEAYSASLDQALEQAVICVIAGKTVIDSMPDRFDRIENLMQ